jgi:AhpD family alkylhydroperoxidase
MQTIQPIQDEQNDPRTRTLLDTVRAELGLAPNMTKTMAQSPAALEGYLNLSGALANGVFDPKFRERVALAVAEAADCDYSLAEHMAQALKAGLTEEEILESREARAADGKTNVALKFARDLTVSRGDLPSDYPRWLRSASCDDREIVELIALVGLNVIGAYFNRVARTVIDYPVTDFKAQAA